ncbi:MAG: V-type ATP synthase subunit F [candidate division WOR-3 bacterium]
MVEGYMEQTPSPSGGRKVLVIAPPEYLPGFQIAGADTLSAEPGQIEELLGDVMNAGKWGLVLVEESLAGHLSPRLSARVFESVSPIVVFIPMRGMDASSPEEYISSVIKGAIGYSIKIRE